MKHALSRHATLGIFLFLSIAQAGISLAFAQAPANAPAKGQQPKFKAIWEPVNVKEDLELMSVHFASADEGWLAGGKYGMSGGVILHTTNGGLTWEIQVGDPASDDRAIRDLYFLDAKIGFAVQGSSGDHQLLRTTDGQNWTQVGTVPEHREDFAFLSPQVGVLIGDNPRILRTTERRQNVAGRLPMQGEGRGGRTGPRRGLRFPEALLPHSHHRLRDQPRNR